MKNYFLRKGETEQGRRRECFSNCGGRLDGTDPGSVEAEAKANGNPVKISNAEQNRIYEEEKRRVWDLQSAALSNPTAPDLAFEDEERVASTPAGLGPRFARSDSRRAFSRGNSLAATPAYAESPREFSPMSMDGESSYTGNPVANKVLRIKRVVSV
jgi:transcription initiation factor TFIID subunit 1